MDTARGWLTRPRVVGTPVRWAAHTGALGAMLAGLVPSGILLGALDAWIAAGTFDPMSLLVLAARLGLAGGLVGGFVGLGMPALLDRVRRWVPLPILLSAVPSIGAGVGVTVMAVALLPSVLVVSWQMWAALSVVYAVPAAAVGAFAASLWAFPFLVGTVLGRSWPVTAAVGLGVPALTALAVFLLTLLF